VPPTPPPPTVSIVTTVLNAQRDLFAATVASVRAQTFRDFEWIVVENPPHGCVGELLAAAPELAIRHVRLPQRPSLANARNEAAAAARGRLLAVLDGDDECLPDRLQRQVERFAREPELAVLGGALLAVDAHGHQLGWRRYPSEHAAIVRAMRRFNPIAQPAVMVARDAFAAVGGYRDYGEGACEDYELWTRMAQAGHRFANLPDVLLRYRIHTGANKAVRLRATLRDTLRLKRDYWRAQFTLGDHARALAERLLLLLPPSWVLRLFLREGLQRTPPRGSA